MTPWRPTTALSRYWATKPFERSRKSWWRLCAATSPSTGRYARMCAPISADWSSALLRRYGYPTGQAGESDRTVLEQAEVLSADWAA